MENKTPSSQTSAEDIAQLAYALWQARGEAPGNPEQDWYKAEELLGAAANGGAGNE